MSGGSKRWRVGVDVGGTFTDIAVLDSRTGALDVFKVPTTPDDPSAGVLDAFRYVAEQIEGFSVGDVDHFMHGTTITTNALIQRRYVRCALLVAEGHRGAIQVQDQQRRGNLFDLHIGHPELIVDEAHVFEVPGRIAADGRVLEEIDTARVAEIADRIDGLGLRSVAVCLLFSFQNPAHEQEVRRVFEKRVPHIRLSLSSDILPRIREWPRISTLLLNASLEPLLVDYVERLGEALRSQGLDFTRLFLMESNGGVMPFSAVTGGGRAVHTLLSGPAAAVQGAASMINMTGRETVVTLDIGGTSADVAVVDRNGALEVTEGQLAGKDTYVPMLDVSTIGAGGGTIAAVGPGGRLMVGPDSAGADPGPACYGKGGLQPTATDADLLLGRLNPDYYLAGRMPLRPDLAEQAVRTGVAEPLGISVQEAAAAILQINDVHMADLIRVVTAKKGVDLATSTLVGCGGAGPLHVAGIADELGIRRMAIPLRPGTFSAVGLLCSDVVQDFVQSEITALVAGSEAAIARRFGELEQLAVESLMTQGFTAESVRCVREIDGRYSGQGFELRLACPDLPAEQLPPSLVAAFHELHRQTYGHDAPAEVVEIVSYRVRAVVQLPRYKPSRLPGHDVPATAAAPVRPVWADGEWMNVPVRQRSGICPGDTVEGALIIEQADTTTFVPPGWAGSCDPFGTLDLQRNTDG